MGVDTKFCQILDSPIIPHRHKQKESKKIMKLLIMFQVKI